MLQSLTPLPKYVAKNSVKADFQRSSLAAFSVGCPPHGFLRQEGPANPSSRRRDAITRVNVRFHVALAIPFAPGNEPYKWSKAPILGIDHNNRFDLHQAFLAGRCLEGCENRGRNERCQLSWHPNSEAFDF